jgi:hypothetical protein
MAFNKEYFRDLAERVVSTFVAGVLAVVGTNAVDLTDLTLWKAAGLAGAAAVLSLLKGLLAKGVGNPESAGL